MDKLKVEGASMISVSLGLNPSIAVFVGEKKASWVTTFPSITDGLDCYLRVPPPVSRYTVSLPLILFLLA